VPPADGFSTGYSNVEGPVWIDDSLYVSHIAGGTNPPPSRILKVTGTAVTVFAPDSGTNGLAVDLAGKLAGARHSDGSVSFIDLANPSNVTPIATAYMGVRFNSPNDLAIRSDGNLYFSDPEWQAPQPPPQGLNNTRVYRVDPSGNVSVVAANLDNPNGVTLSADENTLYVSGGSGLWKYPVNADGTTSAGISVASFLTGTDGMGMDCAGNLYVTQAKSVVVLDANGMMIGSIAINPPGNVTNVAFGGLDRKTLFVTALGNDPGLWTVDLDVPGLPY
jgi:gluconolactonase